MASPAERLILERRILPAIGSDARRLGARPLTGFLGVKGASYAGELLVIGRAVNEWSLPVVPGELADERTRRAYAASVERMVQGTGSCPMAWVIENWGNPRAPYDPNRSAFWRVVRGVAMHKGGEGAQWPSGLAWTNLYKVTSAAGGNPGGLLKRLQFNGCVELLQLELAERRPRVALFITGLDWAEPFIKALGGKWTRPEGEYVEATGRVEDGPCAGSFVVAKHPRGRSEAVWVEEVRKAIAAGY